MAFLKYHTDPFGLWIDTRSSENNSLFGTGKRVNGRTENGIKIQTERTAAVLAADQLSANKLTLYVFLVMDAKIKIENMRFNGIVEY